MKFSILPLVLLMMACSLLSQRCMAAEAAPNPIVVLKTSQNVLWGDGSATIWRYFETCRTEVAKMPNGDMVDVDPLNPRSGITDEQRWAIFNKTKKDVPAKYEVLPTKKIHTGDLPSEGWQAVDFDDSDWPRNIGPLRTLYHAVALMCVRGKFTVNDPSKVSALSLTIAFNGGAIAYLNGQEIGRSSLPDGKIEPLTLAHEYPAEAYLMPDGSLLGRNDKYGYVMDPAEFDTQEKDPALQARYKLRQRTLSLNVPVNLLKKGVNVLAVEIHRAPADPVMFTTWRVFREYADMAPGQRAATWWDRAAIDAITLTAAAPPDAIVANIARAKGVQLWDASTADKMDTRYYGDPNEQLHPVKFFGARNGDFSRQVVLDSTGAIKGIKVDASELRGPNGIIPASAMQIRYVGLNGNNGLDLLETAAPSEVATVPPPWGANVGPSTLQPLWITVHVPRDAAVGRYAGTLSISIDGVKTAQTPIQLDVLDWTVPECNNYVTFMGIIASPETVALQYKVPVWSDAHWALLDKEFDWLAQDGDKQIVIPICRSVVLGNRQSMVTWTKQQDGSYKCDLSTVEKYVDLAVKHLGKVPVVMCEVSDWPPKPGEDGFRFTEKDAATGELKDAVGPAPGTPAFREFLKPVFDGLTAILARHEMAGSMMLAFHPQGYGLGGATKECVEDFNVIAPTARWMRLGHYWFQGNDVFNKGPNGLPWGVVCLKGGAIGVFWDPDEDKPFRGWTNPDLLVSYPFCNNLDYAGQDLGQFQALTVYRQCAEGSLISGRRKPIAGWGRGNIAGEIGYDTAIGVRGLGEIGGDYWPVLKGEHSDKSLYDAGGGWGTVSLPIWSLLGAGKNAPEATVRSQLLHEGLEEAEARVFIENALMDSSRKAKLGADLAARAQGLCDNRTRMLRNFSEYGTLDINWEKRSLDLYEMAAEVTNALK